MCLFMYWLVPALHYFSGSRLWNVIPRYYQVIVNVTPADIMVWILSDVHKVTSDSMSTFVEEMEISWNVFLSFQLSGSISSPHWSCVKAASVTQMPTDATWAADNPQQRCLPCQNPFHLLPRRSRSPSSTFQNQWQTRGSLHRKNYMNVWPARNCSVPPMDLRYTYAAPTLVSVRTPVTYVTRRLVTPWVWVSIAPCTARNAASPVNSAARASSAPPRCPHICWSTRTPGLTLASTAENASTRSQTWRNTPISIQVTIMSTKNWFIKSSAKTNIPRIAGALVIILTRNIIHFNVSKPYIWSKINTKTI